MTEPSRYHVNVATAAFLWLLGFGLLFAGLLGGFAAIVANGQSQTCARSGSTWISTETPNQAGYVTRDTRCLPKP